MEREEKVILKLTMAEIKKIIVSYIVAKYPALENKNIVVDVRDVLQPISQIEVHIEIAESSIVGI